jgi:hypothetical protein
MGHTEPVILYIRPVHSSTNAIEKVKKPKCKQPNGSFTCPTRLLIRNTSLLKNKPDVLSASLHKRPVVRMDSQIKRG